jgi:hypothetical protein
MTKLVFSGKVTAHTDTNGLPVMKANMIIVHDGQEREAEDIKKAFNAGARDMRVRTGVVPMDHHAIEERINQLKDNAAQAETVRELEKAKLRLTVSKAGLAIA